MEPHECVTSKTRVCRDCKQEKPLPDFYRDMSVCRACESIRSRVRYLKNKDRILVRQAKRRIDKRAEIKAYMAEYYVKNRERILERCNEYRNRAGSKDREKVRQKAYYAARSTEIQAKRLAALMANEERQKNLARYQKRFYEENKAYYLAKYTKRRAAKLNATPAWADLKAIHKIYLRCAQISMETGVQHHVDHIVPLAGRNVCGLHVEYNLQVIPAMQNFKKSNKLEG